MEIFIGNLPEKTDAGELCRIFEEVSKPNGLLALLPKSRAQKRRSITSPQYKVVEAAGENATHYGHVVLYPDSLARRAIIKLQGATLRGEPIFVREFIHRAYINDQRLIGWRYRRWSGVERRLSERRQGMFMDEVSEI